MSESSCLQFFLLFCFVFLFSFWGFLFALIARAVRVFIYTIREIYLAPKTFHKFAQLPPKSTARRSLKWPNEQRGRAARQSSSRSRVVHQSDCGSVTHLLPSLSFPFHSHSSFPSASFSAFSPAPTQPQSLWQTVLNPCTALPTHCVRACAWNASGMRVWNASSAQKATSCSANCLTTQVKSAPWACKCAVGAFVCT